MEHENQAIGGSNALTGRLKMPRQNIGFTDPVIGEKAIGCLRVNPILADQRNALPQGTSHPCNQFAQPPFQTLVSKMTPRNLAVKPTQLFLIHRTAPDSVPDKESYTIGAGQQDRFKKGRSLWVIERLTGGLRPALRWRRYSR
jgi:hypothetical protein